MQLKDKRILAVLFCAAGFLNVQTAHSNETPTNDYRNKFIQECVLTALKFCPSSQENLRSWNQYFQCARILALHSDENPKCYSRMRKIIHFILSNTKSVPKPQPWTLFPEVMTRKED